MRNVQTMETFEKAAESWYQRTHSLRRYSEDETKDYMKRAKALILFHIMLIRMQQIIRIKIRLSMPKIPITSFPSGGPIAHPSA